MFRNTLTANDKYPLWDCEGLLSPIEMQLSLKPKTFFHPLVPFLPYTPNFKPFEKKKMIFIATLFRKLQNVKDLVTPLAKKIRFRTPFDSQHVKASQTLVKSA